MIQMTETSLPYSLLFLSDRVCSGANANTQLGSSRELTDNLEEPVLLPLSQRPAGFQSDLNSSEYHVFEIDDCACVQRLWQVLQSSGKDLEGITAPQGRGNALEWSPEQKDMLAIFYER